MLLCILKRLFHIYNTMHTWSHAASNVPCCHCWLIATHGLMCFSDFAGDIPFVIHSKLSCSVLAPLTTLHCVDWLMWKRVYWSSLWMYSTHCLTCTVEHNMVLARLVQITNLKFEGNSGFGLITSNHMNCILSTKISIFAMTQPTCT